MGDLGDIRRKSIVWEEQIISIKNRTNARLDDVPLAPSLTSNESVDGIDLRSKFTLNTNRKWRSQSVPTNRYLSDGDMDDDDDILCDNEVIHRSLNAYNAQKRQTINSLDVIIDEDEELKDLNSFHSPLSLNEFHYPSPDVSYNGTINKRDSAMTMISISESLQTPSSSTSTPQKKRLSNIFKALSPSQSTRNRALTENNAKTLHQKQRKNSILNRLKLKKLHKNKNKNKLNREPTRKRAVTPDPTPNPYTMRRKRSKSDIVSPPSSPPPPKSISISYQKIMKITKMNKKMQEKEKEKEKKKKKKKT